MRYVITVKMIIITIAANAAKYAPAPKNSGDQMKLKIIWMIKNSSPLYFSDYSARSFTQATAPAAPPISRYRIVHTMGNKNRGGAKRGFTSS